MRLFSGFLKDHTVQHVHVTFGREDGHSSDNRQLMLRLVADSPNQTTQHYKDITALGEKNSRLN